MMLRLSCLWTSILALQAILVGCGVNEEKDVASDKAPSLGMVQLRAIDTSNEVIKSSIVFIRGPYGNCSGALITARKIGFSKHCVQKFRDGKIKQALNADAYSVYFGAESGWLGVIPGKISDVVKVHPESDVAVLPLEFAIDDPGRSHVTDNLKGFKPVNIWQHTKLDGDDPIVIAGYGHRAADEPGSVNLHSGHMFYVGHKDSYPLNSKDEATGLMVAKEYFNAAILKPGIEGHVSCYGDSGGPVLGFLDGKQWGLVGFISGGDCKSVTYVADVRQLHDFLWD